MPFQACFLQKSVKFKYAITHLELKLPEAKTAEETEFLYSSPKADFCWQLDCRSQNRSCHSASPCHQLQKACLLRQRVPRDTAKGWKERFTLRTWVLKTVWNGTEPGVQARCLSWAPAPSWQETWQVPAKKRGESREEGQAVICIRVFLQLLGAKWVLADDLHLHLGSDAVPSGQGRSWAGCLGEPKGLVCPGARQGKRNATETHFGASGEHSATINPGLGCRSNTAQLLFASNSETVNVFP